jgi:hypothetical protein
MDVVIDRSGRDQAAPSAERRVRAFRGRSVRAWRRGRRSARLPRPRGNLRGGPSIRRAQRGRSSPRRPLPTGTGRTPRAQRASKPARDPLLSLPRRRLLSRPEKYKERRPSRRDRLREVASLRLEPTPARW